MCGIALIISSLQIDLSSIDPHFKSPKSQSQQVHHLNVLVEDIKEVLLRRGPNNLGSWMLHIRLKTRSNADTEDYSLCNVDDATKRVKSCLCFSKKKNDCITSEIEVLQNDDIDDVLNSVAELHFIGATLQLRGTDPVLQPLVDVLGNVLVYNGEIFGGIQIDNIGNDAEILMHALGRCSSCDHSEYNAGNICVEEGQISVLGLLSMLKGPWALIYWQSHSKTLWFGRDAFGRRSLLVHWPTSEDPRFLLSSVSPPSSIKKSADSEAENGTQDLDFWEELPCGVYSLKLEDSKLSGSFVGEVRKHEWTNPALKELIKWERISVECNTHEINTVRLSSKSVQNIAKSTSSNGIQSPSEVALVNGITTCKVSLPALKVLIALKESVTQRTIINPIMENKAVPVAVLFSGGLDSMILAALLDECLDPCYEIDLLNVSFDGEFAPDRISARAGMKELQNISPSRRWNLVEIDADLSNLITETEHVMSLISPSRTYMDLNIGIALWLAAGGDGWVYTNSERVKYKSEATILLVGSGADEQCAGYSRHRTKFRLGGWVGLHEEMKLDMQRIWKRNLGRDDRCISDTGKEARFPFLDEDVIKTLLEIPLCEVADLNLPVGKGDKKILREVAQLLGFKEAAFLPKRAIQFGSRIARESNRKNFGSNRAANQASAGSAVIPSTI